MRPGFHQLIPAVKFLVWWERQTMRTSSGSEGIGWVAGGEKILLFGPRTAVLGVGNTHYIQTPRLPTRLSPTPPVRPLFSTLKLFLGGDVIRGVFPCPFIDLTFTKSVQISFLLDLVSLILVRLWIRHLRLILVEKCCFGKVDRI